MQSEAAEPSIDAAAAEYHEPQSPTGRQIIDFELRNSLPRVRAPSPSSADPPPGSAASSQVMEIDPGSTLKIVKGEFGYVLEDVPHLTDYLPDLPVSSLFFGHFMGSDLGDEGEPRFLVRGVRHLYRASKLLLDLGVRCCLSTHPTRSERSRSDLSLRQFFVNQDDTVPKKVRRVLDAGGTHFEIFVCHIKLSSRKTAQEESILDVLGPAKGYVVLVMRPNVYFESDDVNACIVTCGGRLHNAACTSFILGLTPKSVNDIHKRGGTILSTSRGGHDTLKIVDNIQDRGINQEIRRRRLKVAVAGIPKTIDNDIAVIDKSFGFDTAVEEAQRAINAAHVEAESVENGIGGSLQ
ncbi:hypothetical protein BHM03_00055550 [Ensete ventricosum]|nr:hypothetical protein BHM03_00055550 [Ensete ventricosum]